MTQYEDQSESDPHLVALLTCVPSCSVFPNETKVLVEMGNLCIKLSRQWMLLGIPRQNEK